MQLNRPIKSNNKFPALCIAFIAVLWLLLNAAQAQSAKLKLDENDYVTSGFFTLDNSTYLLSGVNGNAAAGAMWNWSRVNKAGSTLMDIETRNTMLMASTPANPALDVLILQATDGSFTAKLIRALGTTGSDVFSVTKTGATSLAGGLTISAGGLTISAGGLTVNGGSVALTNPLGISSGGTGLTSLATGIQTFLSSPTSSSLRAAMLDESGTGVLLFGGGALGTPASGVLTNCTGLPATALTGTLSIANGGTGVSTIAAAQTALQVPAYGAAQTLTAAQMQQLAINSGAVDPKLVILREDFFGGTAAASGSIGETGLTSFSQSGVLAIGVNQGAFPNMGQCQLVTGAVLGNGGAVSLDYGADAGNPIPDVAQPGWDVTFILALPDVTNCVVRVGLIPSPNVAYNAVPTRGLYFRYSTALGDTNWMRVSNVGGVETATSTGVAPVNGAFVKLRVRMVSSLSALFSVNGSETSVSTSASGSVAPRLLLHTNTVGTRSALWDFLGFIATTTR